MKALQLLIKSLIGTLFFLLILFLSAGRLNYWQGWVFASICIISTLLNSLTLLKRDELAEERSTVKAGTKSWDKKITAISAVLLILLYAVAGLDSGRFLWTGNFPPAIYALGAILIVTGEVVFLTAQHQNKFFSSVMRIQADRGHTVCDTGIYRIVRHPAYFGMIVTSLGIPLLLGSLWSYIPSAFSILLILIRTSLEDNTLIRELEGYREYTVKTPYRIFPGIW
ncbi:MAG TPA: isoprenylcysteine carboxylmethyltransferase family protein [Bacteroidales bacterium]|nr:isoprenylcysteine carboxylmethyltransferase family protein [Bacteroidales bacterium]